MEAGPFSLLAYACNTINLVPWSLTSKTSEIILFKCGGGGGGGGGNIAFSGLGLGYKIAIK